jgi:hypothetical protein
VKIGIEGNDDLSVLSCGLQDRQILRTSRGDLGYVNGIHARLAHQRGSTARQTLIEKNSH